MEHAIDPTMKPIRLLAVDLDGTLLDKHSDVSPANAAALLRAEQQGIRIALASGKPYPAFEPHLRRFALTGPQIALNGGFVVVAETDQVLLRHPLAEQEAQRVIAALVEMRLQFVVYHERCSAVLNALIEPERLKHLSEIDEPAPMRLDAFDPQQPVFKILTFTRIQETEQEERLRQLLLLGGDDRGVRLIRTSPELLEFIPSGGGKGPALQKAAEYLKLQQQEIAAIGDSENDISMLSYAAYAFARGNAGARVRGEADCIVADNEHDGVAEAIDMLIARNAALIAR